MKRKILIAIGSIFFLSFVFLIIFLRQNGQTAPEATPPRPNIPEYVSGKLPITFSEEVKTVQLPKELPMLNVVKKTITKENAQNLAANLEIEGQIEEFEDSSEGVKYYLTNDSHFLVITPKNSKIKYGKSSAEFGRSADKNLKDEDYKNIALNFFLRNGFFQENQIKPSFVKYLKTNTAFEGFEETDKNNAEAVQVSFSFESQEYEVYSQFSATPSIYVQILLNGEVFFSEAFFAASIQSGLTKYPLKTLEEIKSNISEAKLINLSGDYISISDISLKNIQELNIQSIEIAYLLEERENDIQPVFVLKGPVKITDSTTTQAILYMPAFK